MRKSICARNSDTYYLLSSSPYSIHRPILLSQRFTWLHTHHVYKILIKFKLKCSKNQSGRRKIVISLSLTNTRGAWDYAIEYKCIREHKEGMKKWWKKRVGGWLAFLNGKWNCWHLWCFMNFKAVSICF